MLKMSDQCKEQMINDYGFDDNELMDIENFMNKNNNKTAGEILNLLIKDKKLSNKQKIIISYVVGTSAEAARNKEKDMVIETNSSMLAS